jgi:crotonobetainyl-CoA:carnitine CoA-transferase CaiB-like acyl-CoA transferase
LIKLLNGVKVLECAVLQCGDQAGRLLGDLGADVIKVEQPGVGDYLREIGGLITPHHSIRHMIANRNKRSITLNLRTQEGKDIFYRMLEDTDIVVDGFAGDACARLGIGYQQLRQAKPDIIYVQVSGFGARGPYANVPVHGKLMGALGGAITLKMGEDGLARAVASEGIFTGEVDSPLAAAMWGVMTALAALNHRTETGEGAYIDAAGSDGSLALQYNDKTQAWNDARLTDRATIPNLGHPHSPKYAYYETKDGKFIMFAAIEHKFWDNFCRVTNRPDLQEIKEHGVPVDFHDGGRPDLCFTLKDIFLERTVSEWMDLASRHDIPIAPVQDVDGLLTDKHLRAREIISESVHPGAGPFTTTGWAAPVMGQPFEVAQHAPTLGQHTDEVYAAMGFTPQQLDGLRLRKVI